MTATFNKSNRVVTIDFTGAGAGTVLVTPGNLSFNADGTLPVPTHTAVTLTATPGAGVGFGGWTGAGCSGFGGCSFTADSDTTVMVDFDPPNKVFVTSTTIAPGALGGLVGADAFCSARATAANLPGTFRAFLGSSTATAWTRLSGFRGWGRTDGKPFGDTVTDLQAGRTFYPPIDTETGVELTTSGITQVVTGVNGGTSAGTCTDWTSTSGGSFDVIWGEPRSGYATFAQDGSTSCNTAMRLYCFEVSRTVLFKPPVPTTASRIAFMSASGVTGSIGLAGADAQCQAEATAASLPGTYRAMLAGNGATAASRFSSAGGPWYRTDYVQLSNAATDLLAGTTTLWAAMSLRADGLTQEQQLVWTGAATVATAGTSAGTCAGWGSTAGTTGATTYGNRLGADWFGPFTSGTCNDTQRLFCFQQ